MMKREDIEKLKGKFTATGVPHTLIPGKLFYHYGTIVEVSDFDVKIELPKGNGFRLIPLDDIQDIHRMDKVSTNGQDRRVR